MIQWFGYRAPRGLDNMPAIFRGNIRIGIILILIAAGGLFYTRRFDPQPLHIPLNLRQDYNISASFIADTDAEHWVEIDFKRSLPQDELGTALTAISNSNAVRNSKPTWYKGRKLPRVLCSVFNNGREVLYDSYTGIYDGETYGAVVKSFTAIAGQKYIVKAKIKGGTAKLQAANPSLIAEVFREPVAFSMNSIMVIELTSYLAFLLGLTTFTIAALKAAATTNSSPSAARSTVWCKRSKR